MRRFPGAACCLLLASIPCPAAAQLLGPEFQVNSATTGHQLHAAVAADGSGGFFVVWEVVNEYGSGLGVFGRRFDATAVPAGDESRIDDLQLPGPHAPAVAGGPGAFVVWHSWQGDNYQDVFGKRLDGGGDVIEFRVNTYTSGNQEDPAVAGGAGGDFVVVWSSSYQNESGVFGQRYDSAGVPLGAEFEVSGLSYYAQDSPAVSADAAGGFVVVWRRLYDIYAQRFEPAGVPAGTSFLVNSYTTSFQDFPAVAVAGSGDFVVVWDGYQDGWGKGVFGQRFDSTGQPIGGEFQVNTFTPRFQGGPAVAADGEGDFLVVWTSEDLAGSEANVLGQRFDSSGGRVGSEFQVNRTAPGFQVLPAVAATGERRFVVVWASSDQDGSGWGVFGQRVEFPFFFDGFEAGDACAWSAAVGGGCP
jgi:hypothetical protein